MMTDEEKLANLARNKQRARRRGDPNFFRISKEHKELKKKIADSLVEKERE